jgi:hypothetical protein
MRSPQREHDGRGRAFTRVVLLGELSRMWDMIDG